MAPTKRKAGTSSTNSPVSGSKLPPELETFLRFAASLKIEDGSPLELYPEQVEMLTPYFEGVEETIILLPKKNGKSSLIAALGLYHLLVTPFANGIIVASSRDQAEIVLDQAKMFIRQNAALRSRMHILKREIESKIDGGVVQVLASDQDTADGQLPTLAVVDELHRHKDGQLRGVLALGLGARGGKMITISTAGASSASPLGVLRDRMWKSPGFVRDTEARRSYLRLDDDVAFLEWCLNDDDDPEDLELAKIVNPAPWKTIERLRKDRGKVTASEWLRLGCGVWTEVEEPWVAATVWDACPKTEPITDGEVSVGIRVGQGHATAGVVWVQAVDGVYQTDYKTFSQLSSLEPVEDFVRGLNSRFKVRHNAYVSKTFDRSADLLSDEGLTMVTYPVGTRTMDIAETLLKMIGDGRLAHEGPGTLRTQVLAGQAKQIEAGWKWVDTPGAAVPTDLLFALAAAVHVAETQKPHEVMFAWS